MNRKSAERKDPNEGREEQSQGANRQARPAAAAKPGKVASISGDAGAAGQARAPSNPLEHALAEHAARENVKAQGYLPPSAGTHQGLPPSPLVRSDFPVVGMRTDIAKGIICITHVQGEPFALISRSGGRCAIASLETGKVQEEPEEVAHHWGAVPVANGFMITVVGGRGSAVSQMLWVKPSGEAVLGQKLRIRVTKSMQGPGGMVLTRLDDGAANKGWALVGLSDRGVARVIDHRQVPCLSEVDVIGCGPQSVIVVSRNKVLRVSQLHREQPRVEPIGTVESGAKAPKSICERADGTIVYTVERPEDYIDVGGPFDPHWMQCTDVMTAQPAPGGKRLEGKRHRTYGGLNSPVRRGPGGRIIVGGECEGRPICQATKRNLGAHPILTALPLPQGTWIFKMDSPLPTRRHERQAPPFWATTATKGWAARGALDPQGDAAQQLLALLSDPECLVTNRDIAELARTIKPGDRLHCAAAAVNVDRLDVAARLLLAFGPEARAEVSKTMWSSFAALLDDLHPDSLECWQLDLLEELIRQQVPVNAWIAPAFIEAIADEDLPTIERFTLAAGERVPSPVVFSRIEEQFRKFLQKKAWKSATLLMQVLPQDLRSNLYWHSTGPTPRHVEGAAEGPEEWLPEVGGREMQAALLSALEELGGSTADLKKQSWWATVSVRAAQEALARRSLADLRQLFSVISSFGAESRLLVGLFVAIAKSAAALQDWGSVAHAIACLPQDRRAEAIDQFKPEELQRLHPHLERLLDGNCLEQMEALEAATLRTPFIPIDMSVAGPALSAIATDPRESAAERRAALSANIAKQHTDLTLADAPTSASRDELMRLAECDHRQSTRSRLYRIFMAMGHYSEAATVAVSPHAHALRLVELVTIDPRAKPSQQMTSEWVLACAQHPEVASSLLTLAQSGDGLLRFCPEVALSPLCHKLSRRAERDMATWILVVNNLAQYSPNTASEMICRMARLRQLPLTREELYVALCGATGRKDVKQLADRLLPVNAPTPVSDEEDVQARIERGDFAGAVGIARTPASAEHLLSVAAVVDELHLQGVVQAVEDNPLFAEWGLRTWGPLVEKLRNRLGPEGQRLLRRLVLTNPDVASCLLARDSRHTGPAPIRVQKEVFELGFSIEVAERVEEELNRRRAGFGAAIRSPSCALPVLHRSDIAPINRVIEKVYAYVEMVFGADRGPIPGLSVLLGHEPDVSESVAVQVRGYCAGEVVPKLEAIWSEDGNTPPDAATTKLELRDHLMHIFARFDRLLAAGNDSYAGILFVKLLGSLRNGYARQLVGLAQLIREEKQGVAVPLSAQAQPSAPIFEAVARFKEAVKRRGSEFVERTVERASFDEHQRVGAVLHLLSGYHGISCQRPALSEASISREVGLLMCPEALVDYLCDELANEQLVIEDPVSFIRDHMIADDESLFREDLDAQAGQPHFPELYRRFGFSYESRGDRYPTTKVTGRPNRAFIVWGLERLRLIAPRLDL